MSQGDGLSDQRPHRLLRPTVAAPRFGEEDELPREETG
jgi:hypothetical protein